MLGHAPLSTVPLSALPGASSPATVSEVDIILHPVPAGSDICLWDPAVFDDCTPVIPPPTGGGGPGGGGATWHPNTGRKSPWERAKTLTPTTRSDPDAKRRLAKLQAADDLEVVRILVTFLGHN